MALEYRTGCKEEVEDVDVKTADRKKKQQEEKVGRDLTSGQQ